MIPSPYFSLNSFSTRFPQNCADSRHDSTNLCGLGSYVTHPSTLMLSETALRWLKNGFPRLASRISLTEVIASCRGFRSSIKTGPCMSGFLAFVVTRMNFRCATNALNTLDAYIFISLIPNFSNCLYSLALTLPRLIHH